MGEVVVAGRITASKLLAFVEADRKAGKGITGYEYAVLVTNTELRDSQLWASSTAIGPMPRMPLTN